VLSNGHIGYGLGLTALFEVLLTVAVPRWRRPAVIATTTIVAVLAVLGWQYIALAYGPMRRQPAPAAATLALAAGLVALLVDIDLY
jgi:hypothetical protein